MSDLTKKRVTFYNPLGGTIQTLSSNFETIPAEGKTILKQLADFIEAKASNKEKAELVFICTHNSRRNHISQIWEQGAAAYYRIEHVLSFAGGSEATAFHPRAVDFVKRIKTWLLANSGKNQMELCAIAY